MDWRRYDNEIDPNRKSKRPFTYKLFMDVIRVHLMPSWSKQELHNIDIAVVDKFKYFQMSNEFSGNGFVLIRKRIMDEVTT